MADQPEIVPPGRVLDLLPALVAVYNIRSGKYFYVNRAITKLLGYRPADFLEKGIGFVAGLVHPDDFSGMIEKNRRALQKANSDKSGLDRDPIVSFEYRMQHKNGSWRWFQTDGRVYSRDSSGRVECVMNISVDITARKEAEENIRRLAHELEAKVTARTLDLQASEERYQAFLSHSSDGIWRFELRRPVSVKLPVSRQIAHFFRHAYLAECNDVLARMYGFRRSSEIVGAGLSDLLIPSDRKNIDYLAAFIKSGYRLTGAESHEKDKDGNHKYFSNSLVGVVENGYLKRAWGTQIDITQRKEMELRKNDFISIASHELKTPLTSLKVYSQILTRKSFDYRDKRTIAIIRKTAYQVDRISVLVNELLDVTRLQEGGLILHPEKFSLNRLVDEVVEEVRITSPDYPVFVIHKNRGFLYADKFRIYQILQNLLANAVKFSAPGSRITVTTRSQDRIMSVAVRDTGIGISGADQKKLFDRFFQVRPQTSSGGLGLGLFISSEIAKLHHGRLGVRSVPGKGSVFTLSLPVSGVKHT